MPTRAEILLAPCPARAVSSRSARATTRSHQNRGGWNSASIDHMTREGLVAKYTGHPGVDVSRIEEVDYIWNGGSLSDAVPPAMYGTFDAFVASHVIEHTPDLIAFLDSASTLLKPEGVVVLAVPDKAVLLRLLPAADHHRTGDRGPCRPAVAAQPAARLRSGRLRCRGWWQWSVGPASVAQPPAHAPHRAGARSVRVNRGRERLRGFACLAVLAGELRATAARTGPARQDPHPGSVASSVTFAARSRATQCPKTVVLGIIAYPTASVC